MAEWGGEGRGRGEEGRKEKQEGIISGKHIEKKLVNVNV